MFVVVVMLLLYTIIIQQIVKLEELRKLYEDLIKEKDERIVLLEKMLKGKK